MGRKPKPHCPAHLTSDRATPVEQPCPKCGATVEIWTDEESTTCACGEVVHREAKPTS